VQQGDDVTIHVTTTDAPIEVHLHGYDIEQTATPAMAASMHFIARASGRFPIEIHRQGKQRVIGYLEVHPR
jgi:heme/copper-type cytochrome/quinol oxidase subunit 2